MILVEELSVQTTQQEVENYKSIIGLKDTFLNLLKNFEQKAQEISQILTTIISKISLFEELEEIKEKGDSGPKIINLLAQNIKKNVNQNILKDDIKNSEFSLQ